LTDDSADSAFSPDADRLRARSVVHGDDEGHHRPFERKVNAPNGFAWLEQNGAAGQKHLFEIRRQETVIRGIEDVQ
jgi:hypothetical protein